MRRFILLLIFVSAAYAKTPVDLMLEGRYLEARTILDSTSAEPRYGMLLNAMTEPDAVLACSLYAVISQRYPGTECDSLAQQRLQWAAAAGVPIKPITEVKPEPEVTTAKPIADVKPEPEVTATKSAQPVTTTAPETKPAAQPQITAQPEKAKPETHAVTAAPIETIKPLPLPTTEQTTAVQKQAVEPLPVKVTPHDVSSAHPGEWFVQVGAFGNHENARNLAAKLQKDGYGTALVPKTTNGKELLQVRVGGYKSRDECKAAADVIKVKYKLPAALVNE